MPTDFDIPDQQPKKKAADPGTARRTPWLKIVAFVTLFFFAMTWFVAVNVPPEGGPPQIHIAQNEAEAGLLSNLLMAIPLAVFNFFCKIIYDILVKPLLAIIKAIMEAIDAIFEIFADIKKMMRDLDEFFCNDEEAAAGECEQRDLGQMIEDGVDHLKEEMGEAYDDALVASDQAIGRMRQSAKGCMSKFLNIGNAVGALGSGASLDDVDDLQNRQACEAGQLMRTECLDSCDASKRFCDDRCNRLSGSQQTNCQATCVREKESCDTQCGPQRQCGGTASLNHPGPAGLDMIMSGQFLAGVYGQGPTPDELLASADQRGPRPPPCADLEALNNITARDVLELAYLYHHDKLDVIPEKFIALVPSYYLETVNFMVGDGPGGLGGPLIDNAEAFKQAINSGLDPINIGLRITGLAPFLSDMPIANLAGSMNAAAAVTRWIEETFWNEIVQPKLKDMAAQLSAVAFKQVEMIGRFFDAQIAIDAQRSLQELMAVSARDYTPSEAVCRFGTAVQSLAASDHKASVTQIALSEWAVARQMRRSGVSDQENLTSRWDDVKAKFCDAQDYAGQDARSGCTGDRALLNRDINYTNSVDGRLTLELNALGGAETNDSKSLFALARNLYGNEPMAGLSDPEKNMKIRSLIAKRSVAMNSFNAIAAQRAPGTAQSKDALKAILGELGFGAEDQQALLTGIGSAAGTNPSYYAQMEVLTKKIYQNPNFYVNLMDKPANVERQQAAMQGFGLMQQRDIYNSLLRSEMLLSVLLEMEIERAQSAVGGGIQ